MEIQLLIHYYLKKSLVFLILSFCLVFTPSWHNWITETVCKFVHLLIIWNWPDSYILSYSKKKEGREGGKEREDLALLLKQYSII